MSVPTDYTHAAHVEGDLYAAEPGLSPVKPDDTSCVPLSLAPARTAENARNARNARNAKNARNADSDGGILSSSGARLPFPHLPGSIPAADLRSALARLVSAELSGRVSRASLPEGHRDAAAVAALSKVPLGTFVSRLAGMTREPVSVAVAALLLDKFYAMHPGAPFSEVNAHRLVLVATVVADKLAADIPYPNTFWANQLAGVFDLADVNAMEIEFVRGLACDVSFDGKALEDIVAAATEAM